MYKQPKPLDMPPPKGFWRWLWPQKSDHDRLQREFDSFRIELALLEARTTQSDPSWAEAAHDQLNKVECYLRKHKDVEGGWVCLHAARRHAVHALDPQELAMSASMLRAEAPKLASWRSDEIKKLLSVDDELLTATRIINAMALRDEYSSNQYHKIWLMGNQLAILLLTCGLGLILLAPLVTFFSLHPEGTISPQPEATIALWGYQMVTAVLFFGLLGAGFSAALSLINATGATRIPERVANRFVTIARALFGAGVGLAGYAFYQSKVLNIHVGQEGGPAGALAVAFLFGFAGERLIASVLGSLGANKS